MSSIHNKPSSSSNITTKTTHNVLHNQTTSSTTNISSWAIVMACTNESHFDLSLQNLLLIHANRHDYDVLATKYIDTINSTMSNKTIQETIELRYQHKILLILAAFELGNPNVFWKDSDVIIHNCNLTLNTLEHHRLKSTNSTNNFIVYSGCEF